MARLGVCGAECRVFGSGTHLISAGTAPTFSTTTYRSGLASLRCLLTSNGQSYVDLSTNSNGPIPATNRALPYRFYMRFATLPTGNCWLFAAAVFLGTTAGLYYVQSEGKVYCRTGSTNGSSGVAITTNTWYKVDVLVNKSSNPWTVDAKINGTSLGQATNAVAAEDLGYIAVGLGTTFGDSIQGDMFLDDMAWGNAAGDYPFDAGSIESSIPNADGTHNVAGINDFERTLTGTDIDNSTTDAYQLIAKRPLPSSIGTFINLIAPPNATDYVECLFENAPAGEAPVAVEALAAIHALTTTANNLRIALRDTNGGTQDDIWNTGVGSTSLRFIRKFYTSIPGGSTWTETAFNALSVRCYTSDANPDPYFDAIMLEAEYAEGGDVSASMALATATAVSLAMTGAIEAIVGLATASAISLAMLSGIGVVMRLATADAISLGATGVITVTGALATANAISLPITGALEVASALATANAISLPIESPSLNVLASLALASALSLPVTFSIEVLTGLATASAISLAMTEFQTQAVDMALALASALSLSATAAIEILAGLSTASAISLALTTLIDAVQSMSLATASGLSLAITVSINILGGLATASAISLSMTSALVAVLSLATATAISLAMTTVETADQLMALATASAISLTMVVTLVVTNLGLATATATSLTMTYQVDALALMALAMASAQSFAATAAVVAAVGLATASGISLAGVVGVVMAATLASASAMSFASSASIVVVAALPMASATSLAMIITGVAVTIITAQLEASDRSHYAIAGQDGSSACLNGVESGILAGAASD